MNREELFSLVRSTDGTPGLVRAHGLARALGDYDAGLSARLDELSREGRVYSGKVRDRVDLGERLLLYTSDRVSAFDRVLGMVPFKGEVLNRLSIFWFGKTTDIIKNHVIYPLGAHGLLARKARVLPLEIVVRGYLTGSAWRDYAAGRPVSGLKLGQGLRQDQKFERPLITPSTKEDLGSHDQPISREQILSRKIVGKELWEELEATALALFARGTEVAASHGLILVDTKYEFGIDPEDDRLMLVDEVHTPDSSRYWYADSYESHFSKGIPQRALDKEYLRSWLLERKWSGNGEPPAIPNEVFAELSWRYVQAFQDLGGADFRSISAGFESEAREILSILR